MSRQLSLLLTKNKSSVLFLKPYKDKFSKNDLNKLKKSTYKGDRDLYALLTNNNTNNNSKQDENNNDDNVENRIPTVIKRVKEPANLRGTLKRFKGPYQSFQADVADFNFTRPSGTDPKYVLLLINRLVHRFIHAKDIHIWF